MTCVNSVSVYPKSIMLKKGNWYYGAYAEVCPCEAGCKEVVWHSDNPSVASVNASSGYIYANAAGTAKIYATATDGSGFSDYLTVTVKEIVKVTSVSLSSSSLLIEKGKYHTLTATVLPTNAANKTLAWCSDNPCVAIVCDGVVYAVSEGTATITATATDGSEKHATCTVSVTEDVLVTSITINPTEDLMVGQSAFLSATAAPANATNKAVLWTSDNAEVASINPNSGLVYANAVGTAKVTATARDGSGVYGTIDISVSPVPVTSISISQDEVTLSVGETTTLSATVSPSNATDKSVIWTSSDTNVASIDPNSGRIEAKLSGSTVITATAIGGKVNSSTLITVQRALTYPDTLIEHADTRAKIIRIKTLIDENTKAYLKGKISFADKKLIEDQLELECNIAKADYIVVGNNPTSEYAYTVLGGNRNAIVPFSFSENLKLNSTGLAVIVVQRALEVMGYYDPKDSGTYGVFDSNTYDAACLYPVLLSYDREINQKVFDNASFNVLFQASTITQRTYEGFTELNKYRTIHNTVAIQCAAKVGGTYAMAKNKIAFGNSTGTYYGYADVLKDTGSKTYIWEVKPDKELYYRENGIGERQLQRYIYAGNNYSQSFSTPLTIGYDIGNFSIPFLSTSYINVRHHRVPQVPTSALNGLVLYKKSESPEYALETSEVAVPVPEPSAEYQYSSNYSFSIPSLDSEMVIIMGIAIVVGIICVIALSGGTSVLLPAVALLA